MKGTNPVHKDFGGDSVSDSLDYRIIGGRQIIDAAKGRPSHVNQDKVRKYASFRRIESAFEYLLFRHPQHNAW